MNDIDVSDMQQMIKAFPRMLRSSHLPKDIPELCTKLRKTSLGGICITGMGGSSIAGQYIQSLLQDTVTVPIINIHDYRLPAYVDSKWVAISVSYSGNTEETLLTHEEAKRRGCQTFSIASGGKLLSDDESTGKVPLPPNFQPRAAFPKIFSTLLHLVECLIGENPTDFESISDTLLKKEEQWESSPIAPKEMAKDLIDRIPVFIGSRHLSVVAYRAKCQVNENAKALAFSSEIPEANHNEIESFDEMNDQSILPIFLRSAFEDEQLTRRIDITTKIYEDEGFTPLKLSIKGSSKIEEALLMTYYLDRVTVELAELRGVDPTSVDKIAKLKSKLGQA